MNPWFRQRIKACRQINTQMCIFLLSFEISFIPLTSLTITSKTLSLSYLTLYAHKEGGSGFTAREAREVRATVTRETRTGTR